MTSIADLRARAKKNADAQRAIWLHLKKSQGKQWVTYDAFYQAAMETA